MKTLYLDIENSPNLAYVWGLWQQTVSLPMLIEASQVLSVAWKWRGERAVSFASNFTGHQEMLTAVHGALNEADLVVHFNGKSFDIKHLNREFVLANMAPPAPYAQLDLYQQVKRQFRFPSNKLQHISEALGLEGKVKHSGFDLWVRCLANEASAWREMETYNKRDVVLLEELHDRLSGWLPGAPNAGLYSDSDDPICPQCGSADLRKEGHAYALTGAYQRYQCRSCGAWSKDSRRVSGAEIRGIAS